jgi:hypothetical protein
VSPENRRQYVDSIIGTLCAQESRGNSVPISEFDKARLFSSLGLLVHDGLTANATALAQASRDLQSASADSSNTARQLKNYTIVLAVATGLLVLTSGWQAYETHETNVKPESRATVLTVQPAQKPPAASSPMKRELERRR